MKMVKKLCSWFNEIDSFALFKYKRGLESIMHSSDRLFFTVSQNNIRAYLLDDYSISVFSEPVSYLIPVEKKPCNYGGFYHFFHCPRCDKRMRKLYLVEGKYQCRKCANLGYLSQRLSASRRPLYIQMKIEMSLKNRAGNIHRKPPWQKQYTFYKSRKKYIDYGEMHHTALFRELQNVYGQQANFLLDSYFMLLPLGFDDVYDRAKDSYINC